MSSPRSPRLHYWTRGPPDPVADMEGDPKPEIAGPAELVGGNVERRELRTARCESHRYELVVGGKMRSPHPVDVGKIRWPRARWDPLVISVAVAEDCP
jgi:hypothetical protein